MSKNDLTKFNSAELSEIISKMGQENLIFNSEAQFQFELAWRIRKQFDCEVKLEELTRIETKESEKGVKKVKKDYTDIILEKDQLRIAIELKYKTAKYESDGILLMNHGAVDLGCYDFYWDVNRIQRLISSEKESPTIKYKYGCNRGYAVMLTNEKKYWGLTPKDVAQTIYRDFLIGASDDTGKGCLVEGQHQWYQINGELGDSATIEGTFRAQKIYLNHDYPFQWREYCSAVTDNAKASNNVFKFMIIAVEE